MGVLKGSIQPFNNSSAINRMSWSINWMKLCWKNGWHLPIGPSMTSLDCRPYLA